MPSVPPPILTPYRLVDCEEMARRFPDTFEIPSREVRENLAAVDGSVAGYDIVQLIFIDDKDRERVWVRVLRRMTWGGYEGRLLNQPGGIDAKWGDLVSFGAEHVCQVGAEGEA